MGAFGAIGWCRCWCLVFGVWCWCMCLECCAAYLSTSITALRLGPVCPRTSTAHTVTLYSPVDRLVAAIVCCNSTVPSAPVALNSVDGREAPPRVVNTTKPASRPDSSLGDDTPKGTSDVFVSAGGGVVITVCGDVEMVTMGRRTGFATLPALSVADTIITTSP